MRLAWLVVVAACGSRPPLRRVVFEGELIDAVSHTPVVGATVVVPRASGNSDVALSDGQGRFRVVADAGHRRLSIYDANETIEVDVDVSSQHARLTVERPLVAGLVDRMLRPRTCEGEPRPVAQAELDAIGRLSLARVPTLADAHLLTHPITVTGLADVLAPFAAGNEPDIQADVERTQTKRHYLAVQIDVAGDCATVTSSVRIAQPEGSDAMLCCCTTTDVYVKRAGSWSFLNRLGSICG
jgi:hypothetical protein